MSGFNKLFDSGKKIMAIWILIHATIWIDLSYILAFLDKNEIAESLSREVVITVIAVFATYAVSSVADKVNEAKNGTIKHNNTEDSI